MSTENRATIKSYLETGDVPTQPEMIDLVDSAPNIVDDGCILGGTSGMTAFAGGGQANATLLTNLFTSVTVVASPGDSIRLPNSVAGNMFGIINATPNSMDLFPAVGEQIMALGVNVAQPVAPGEVFFFGSAGSGWAGGRLT